MTKSWDVVVVGAGTAGLAAWRASTAAGAHTALVDGGTLGTTCARAGCMPSKLLIAAANAAYSASGAHRFGADVERSAIVNGAAVLARVRAERDRFVESVMEGLRDVPDASFLRSFARFDDEGRLAIGDQIIEAQAVVVATGSRARRLPALAALGHVAVTSDAVFAWETLPDAVVVFGPGAIGLELGQALARLGVRVTVVGVGGLVGPFSDPAVRAAARVAMAEEFALYPHIALRSVARTTDGVEIVFDADGVTHIVHADYVIEATGRVPNLDRIGLPASTHPDPETMQVGDRPLFLAGDAAADRPVLHEASDEGRIAGENAASWPAVTRKVRRSPLAIGFTEPQLAMVGARFSELDPARIVVGEASFADQGRSRVMLENRGLLHLYADRTDGRLLGAELACPDAEHLAHLLAWSHQLGLTVAQMLALPFYHPVVEEGLRTALRDAQSQLEAAGVRRSA